MRKKQQQADVQHTLKEGVRRAVLLVNEKGSFPAWEYSDGRIELCKWALQDLFQVAEEIKNN